MKSLKLVLAIATVALTAACDARGADDVHTHRAASPHETPAEPSEDRYELEVELPRQSPAGVESLAKVHVHPRGDWHMNTDYPVELELASPAGVKLVSGKLTKNDAERLDDEALTFAVPFTPDSVGQKRFEGQLSFAMCGEQACDPLTVPVDFTVDVAQCDDTVQC